MIRTKPSIWDAVAIILVLALALGLLFLPPLLQSDGERLLVKTPDADYIYDLSINDELTFFSNGVTLTVVICDGAAYVRHSDCPDGVCRTSAPISKSGETILCAPAGVTLTVKGGADDVDFVAG